MPARSDDPIRTSQEAMRPVLPKRFYAIVSVVPEAGGGFAVRLDDRTPKSPARHPIVLPTADAAAAVAEEWRVLEDVIDPARMPMTRLVNSALDVVAPDAAPIVSEIVKYAGSDLLCYRADGPVSLVKAQADAWDPVLTWADETFGARFVLAEGVNFVAQPAKTLAAVEERVRGEASPFALAALHVMTTLTGSALIALAVAAGRLSAGEAWAAAHVDEDHQIARWGEDAEASARRDRRFAEFEAAARLRLLLG